MKIILNSIYTFFRAFGFFAIVFSFLASLLFNSNKYLLLFVFLIIDLFLNMFLKKIASILMGKTIFPIIGSGLRPKGKKSCSYFDIRLKTRHLQNYGMPSGHSQTFAFISTLIGLYLYKTKDKYKNFKYVALIFLTFLAMYMRIYIENCHTIQQTIFGSIIGFLLAFTLVHYFGNPFSMA